MLARMVANACLHNTYFFSRFIAVCQDFDIQEFDGSGDESSSEENGASGMTGSLFIIAHLFAAQRLLRLLTN